MSHIARAMGGVYNVLVEYPGVALHEALHAAVAWLVGVNASYCGPRGRDCLDGRWHVHLDLPSQPPWWQLYPIYWSPVVVGVLGAAAAVATGVSSWLLAVSPLGWAYLTVLWIRASVPSLTDLCPRTAHAPKTESATAGQDVEGVRGD